MMVAEIKGKKQKEKEQREIKQEEKKQEEKEQREIKQEEKKQ